MWLDMEDPFELLAKAIAPPWEPGLESAYSLRPATWQPALGSDDWEHEVMQCTRAQRDEDGMHPCFCVHRFVLRQDAATRLNAAMRGLAEQALDGSAPSETASTVGGYHSSRDLCDWPAARKAGLPCLLASAVQLAARAAAQAQTGGEGAASGDPVGAPVEARASVVADSASPPDEAWLNCLGDGGWNVLHTHPGATFSGAYYVSAGGGGGSGGGGSDGDGGGIVVCH